MGPGASGKHTVSNKIVGFCSNILVVFLGRSGKVVSGALKGFVPSNILVVFLRNILVVFLSLF